LQNNLVQFDEGQVQVDAVLVAGGFGLDAESFMQRLRDGLVTSLFEKGIDEHAGLYRLTFFYGERRLCLTVDDCGNVIERVAHDYSASPT
jgi:hypothetical protein